MKICQSVYFCLSEVSPLDHGLGQFLIFAGTLVVQTWHGDHLLQQHVGQDDDLLQPDAEQDDGQQQSAEPGGSQSLWGRQREEPARGELRQLLRLPCPRSPDCWWN